MSDDPLHESLGDRIADMSIAAAPAMAALAAVNPHHWYLPVLFEALGALIPRRRLERALDMLHRLDDRLRAVEAVVNLGVEHDEEQADLLEEAVYQATRAASADRRQYIANIVAYGITHPEDADIAHRRVLELFDQLNDTEIIHLIWQWAVSATPDPSAFYARHQHVLSAGAVTLNASDEEFDQHTLFVAYKNNLRRLGLVSDTFHKPKKGEMPEFDTKTGMMKAKGSRVTSLGKMLLEYMDISPETLRELPPTVETAAPGAPPTTS